MIRVKQSALSAAVKAALLGAMTVGMVACDSEGDVSTSTAPSNSVTEAADNIVGEVKGLTSDVTGVVVDTNGNPVAGARVYAPGKAAVTTDESGQYYFTDVKVTNVQGNNDETEGAGGPATEEDEIMQQISITIVAPEGFLGGVVTVRPEAQVNNTGGSDTATTDSDENQTTVQTFVSGLLAEAGRAVLPQLSAKVSGYLDDCAIDTDQDGINEDPAVGVMVKADVLGSVAGGALTSNTGAAGATFTLAVGDIPAATTDETGYFELTLPADLSANLLLEGWTSVVTGTQTLQASVSTQDEVVKQSLGQFDVCAISDASEDAAPKTDPQLVSVDGIYTAGSAAILIDADNREYVALDKGVVNDFKLNFSSSIAKTDAAGDLLLTSDAIRVTLNGAEATDATVVLADDMMSFVISFPADLNPEDKVNVFIPEWLARDAEDERIGADADDEGQLYIDENITTTSTAKVNTFVRASFCIFSEPSDDASITLVTQVINENDSADAGTTSLEAYSDAFADNVAVDDIADFVQSQLNGNSTAETEARLTALGNLVADSQGQGTPLTAEYNADLAAVSFTDAVGSISWFLNDTLLSTTDEDANGNGALDAGEDLNGNNTLDAYIGGDVDATSGVIQIHRAKHNDVVKAEAANIFGLVKASPMVTVVDALAPTTVLQESYDITTAGAPKVNVPLVVNGGQSGVKFGNGGELSEVEGAVAATVGNPIIYVQPRHIQPRTSASNLAIQARGTEFDSLTDDMSNRLATGEAGDLNVYDDRPLYDATAFDNWNAISAEIGVAFSENVVLNNTGALSQAGFTANFSGAVANNDVTKTVDNTASGSLSGLTSADLIDVTVDNVLTLANVDTGSTLGFSDFVQDTYGNEAVATTAAQVTFLDAFPPMVESARWDGTRLIILFNENISVAENTDLYLENPVSKARISIQLTDAVENAGDSTDDGDFTVSGNTLTVVTANNVAGQFVGSADPASDEFFYDDSTVVSGDEQHAVLNWDNIHDTNGNAWEDFNAGGDATATDGTGDGLVSLAASSRWDVNAPQFLAVNELGDFEVTWTHSGVVDSDNNGFDDDGLAEITVRFSHPIDTSAISADASISQAELRTLFSIGVDGVRATAGDLRTDGTNDSLSISADYRTITISLDETVTGINVGTTIIWVGDSQAPGTTSVLRSDLNNEPAASNWTLFARP